jgi:hypothetical protein
VVKRVAICGPSLHLQAGQAICRWAAAAASGGSLLRPAVRRRAGNVGRCRAETFEMQTVYFEGKEANWFAPTVRSYSHVRADGHKALRHRCTLQRIKHLQRLYQQQLPSVQLCAAGPVLLQDPSKHAEGVVLFMHGYAQGPNAYYKMLQNLAEAGLLVIAPAPPFRKSIEPQQVGYLPCCVVEQAACLSLSSSWCDLQQTV